VITVDNLAAQLGVTSQEIIDRCAAHGVKLRDHMSLLSARLVERIRKWLREDDSDGGGAPIPAPPRPPSGEGRAVVDGG